MIEFIEAKTDWELEKFAEYKIKLMNEIKASAKQLGCMDKSLQDYDMKRALASASMRKNFLILLEDKYIGNFQISVREALCESTQVVYLHNIFIAKEYRNSGIGKITIDFIKKTYRKPIECECWYEMDSKFLFNALGFRAVRVTFYSDQNCISENKK